jgi:hypothetical protein
MTSSLGSTPKRHSWTSHSLFHCHPPNRGVSPIFEVSGGKSRGGHGDLALAKMISRGGGMAWVRGTASRSPRFSQNAISSLAEVLARPRKASRQSRPRSLRMLALSLRRVTWQRTSFSDPLVCSGISAA